MEQLTPDENRRSERVLSGTGLDSYGEQRNAGGLGLRHFWWRGLRLLLDQERYADGGGDASGGALDLERVIRDGGRLHSLYVDVTFHW